MLNMLWGNNVVADKKRLNDNPVPNISPLLQAYQDLGWDIAVIHVGAAIENVAAFTMNPTLVVDDIHHPSCASCHLIADMIKVAMYTNFVEECTVDMVERKNTLHNGNKNRIPPHTNIYGEMDSSWHDLWTDLFRDDVVIGSLTAWEPKIPNTTNLRLGNAAKVFTWPFENLGKAAPGRKDRKYAHVVPKCSSEFSPFTVLLLEPDLKWLALSLSGEVDLAKVSINGILLQKPERPTFWTFGGGVRDYIKDGWYQILDQVEKADSYELSLCHNSEDPMYNSFVIGVMVPNATASSFQ
jgi:hypothetical protein